MEKTDTTRLILNGRDLPPNLPWKNKNNRAPSKRLNDDHIEPPDRLSPFLFKFAPVNPETNFQHPSQIKAVIKHLTGQEVITAAVVNGGPLKASALRARTSVVETARMLGCSRYYLDKLVKAYKAGGEEAVGQLPWGRGRPEKPHGYTQQEIDVIVSP